MFMKAIVGGDGGGPNGSRMAPPVANY